MVSTTHFDRGFVGRAGLRAFVAAAALGVAVGGACGGGDDDDDDAGAASSESGGSAGSGGSGAEGGESGPERLPTSSAGNATTPGGGSDDDGPTPGESGDDGPEPEECNDPPLPAASFATDIFTPIIAARCSCHRLGMPAGLAMADAATTLTTFTMNMSTVELPYVVPGDRDGSYLWSKVSGTHDAVGGAGGRMPLGAPMPCGEVEAIGAWIDGGANP